MADSGGPKPLWSPAATRVESSTIYRFGQAFAPNACSPGVLDYGVLHTWSTEDVDRFWRSLWEFCDVIGDPGSPQAAVPSDSSGAERTWPDNDLRRHRWFPGAAVNMAENLLADRGRTPDTQVVVEVCETGDVTSLTLGELRTAVATCAAALASEGVTAGDRVAAWMPNTSATLIAMLATISLGAVFSSTSPDFGPDGVVDRFGQIEPTVLFATEGYFYGGKYFDCTERLGEITSRLPTLRRTVVVPYPGAAHRSNEAAAPARDPGPIDTHVVDGSDDVVGYGEWSASFTDCELRYTRVPFDHPGFVLFSSGTTGKPKCIVHRAAGIMLMHMREQRLHSDMGTGDRAFWFTTCGWMMWNWLMSALGTGASIVLYDGSPFHPGPQRLWELAERYGVTHFGVSAKYLDSVAAAGYSPAASHDLSTVRMIGSTGSPLSPERFAWVYEAVAADVHLASISGGTDLCGCFLAGVPTRPVYPGEIQGPALGMEVIAAAENGAALVDQPGELVCNSPFPTIPLGFVGDDDGARFSAAYFDRYPGRWHHGDFVIHSSRDGFIVLGRSDTTLNPGGVRIGTAEIYRQVESISGIEESLVFGQPHGDDTRIVLLVRMAEGIPLDDALQREIRTRIREGCTPRHVPAVIAAVDDLPRTRSNKLVELAVADVVAGRPIRNTEAIANIDALWAIRDLPELAD